MKTGTSNLIGFFLLVVAAGVAGAEVTLTVDGRTATLANGVVTATVQHATGEVSSLKYKGLELIGPGHGYWSFVGNLANGETVSRFGAKRNFSVHVDPKSNGGERAEISCRLGYDGTPGTLPLDVDLRYSLGRADPGLFCYAVWRHWPSAPGISIAEARMVFKVDPSVFDFLTIDANRRREMATGQDWDRGEPLNLKEARRLTTGIHKGEVEHKYDYSAILGDTPAYGWSSTKRGVGFWMINPSIEYISGGATKVELTGHLDGGRSGLPTLLNMWQGSHYGGGPIRLADSEAWAKVIGPFFVYCNSGDGHEALWRDALERAKHERRAWPYPWVDDPEYPLAAGRGAVTGRIVVHDPQAPAATAANALVGLAGREPAVDWQRDGKGYQFWARADADGRFTIANVRPGQYALRAFTDGVLGEFCQAEVMVSPGKTTALGTLSWTPVRIGRQLWEIGFPNRSAAEFRNGDHYWQWGLYLKYPQEFPNDVDFVIGKSDWRRDWNYCQPPHVDANGKTRDTTWTVRFKLSDQLNGRATLRLAFCGSRGGGRVWAAVNGQAIGETGELPDGGIMHRDGIRGYWFERDIAFDAALLRPGENVLTLRSRGRDWTMGVLYDYLRLELDETKKPPHKDGT